MALQVWLPLTTDLRNQGLSDLNFSILNTSTISLTTGGKLAQKCYTSTSNTTQTIVSDKTINLGANQSMFCWVKMTSFYSSASLSGVAGQHRYQTPSGMGITLKYASSTTGYLSVNTATGSNRTYNTYCGSTVINTGTWYHVGYTYDGTTIKLYVNGVLDGSFTLSNMTINTDYIQLFGWSFNATSGSAVHENYTMKGSLQDFRAYDHCLSEKEIKEISKGLVLHCNFKDSNNLVSNWVNGSTYAVRDNTMTCNGLPSLKINQTGNTSNVYRGWSQDITSRVSAGETVTLSFYMYTADKSTIDNGVELRIYQVLTTGTTDWTGIGWSSSVHVDGKWIKYTKTYTLSTNLKTAIANLQVVKNGVFWVSGIKVEKGSVATPYTDYYTNSVLADSSGYDAVITKSGTVTTTGDAPRGAYAALFDSKGHYKVAQPLVSPTNVTVSCWIKPANSGTYSAISCNYNNPASGYWLAVNCEGSGLWFYNGGYARGNKGLLTTGTWYFITFVYDNGNVTWYQNGEAAGTTNLTAKGTTLGITNYIGIGNSYTGSTWNTNYDGCISDFRIYATSLSATDVKNLYDASMSIDNSHNVYCYNLNEDNSTNFSKNGMITANNFVEYHEEPDGSLWYPIAHHYDCVNKLFNKTDDFVNGVYIDEDRWLHMNICNKLTSWEFLFIQKTNNSTPIKYRWIQTTNPFTATYANVAPSAVTRITTTGYTNGGQGGIWKNNSNTAFCIANATSSNWFGAIGCWTHHNGGIPGYPNTVITNGGYDLYVRVDNVQSDIRKIGIIDAKEFIEI